MNYVQKEKGLSQGFVFDEYAIGRVDEGDVKVTPPCRCARLPHRAMI